MSCGAEPPKPAPVPEPPPATAPSGPQASPAAAPRAAIRKPWYHKVVESCGRLWDIYPWIGIAIYIFGGLVVLPGVPQVLQWPVAIVFLLWESVFLFWLIVDILYFGAPLWWLAVVLCCYPVGLVIYVIKGR